MELKCEFSSMQIPGDPKYASAAARYVSEVARTIGMQKQDLESFEKGIVGAIDTLIGYSFEDGEKGTLEVLCERIPEGFKVSLRDKGLPFGSMETEGSITEDQAVESSAMGKLISRLKDHVDEIQLNNLGTEGKEMVLIKHLKNKDITDYYAACDLEPYEVSAPSIASSPGPFKCRVRRLEPGDAAEVSKTIYKTYGYTYPHDYVYYPEKIIALNESGRIFPAVAIAGEEEIAGYGIFRFWEENPQIVELAQGVVKPEFRSLGCFRNITQYLLEQAKSLGVKGAFGEAVTNHTVSQHTVHGFGFRDCGLKLGMVPPHSQFKGMNANISYRVSILMNFAYLQTPQPGERKVYAPQHHKDMIAAIYKGLGVRPEMKKSGPLKIKKAASSSVFKIKQFESLSYARMIIDRYGSNIVDELKIKVKELCLKKTEIIHLYVNLADPLTGSTTGQFEKLGFFFAGILPGGFADGDALILQYLNNVPIDYDVIQVKSAIARKLLAYVRKCDPNSI